MLFHVDDFLSCGDKIFNDDIMVKIRSIFTFGKISQNNFIFTGLQIVQNDKKEIFVNQFDYADKMQIFQYQNQSLWKLLEYEENRMIRKTTGQLSWLASQTRPDLAFDALNLSVCLNRATFKDAKYLKKVVHRAREEKYSIKYSHLGNYEDLHF